MKYLMHRLLALTLAILVLLSAMPQLIAAGNGTKDPRISLGTFSGDMLSGGGTQVQTEAGLFYVGGQDGYIYNMRTGSVPVYAFRAAKLNYADGVLYFARLQEDSFDLCSYELASGRETVLLEDLTGKPGQIYLVEGKRLDFLWEGAVWELILGTGEYRLLLSVPELWSFVPTGCGLIYATGSLFDYSLYADGVLLARHAESYYVDFSLDGGALVYSLNGTDYQIDLRAAFGGSARSVEFAGEPRSVSESLRTLSALLKAGGESGAADEAEAADRMDELNEDVLNEEGNRPPELDPPVDNSIPENDPIDPSEWENDPQAPDPTEPAEPDPNVPEPTEPNPEDPAEPEPEPDPAEPAEPEPTEPAPAEPEPTEPAPAEPEPTEPAPAEPEPTEPAPVEPEPTEPEPAEPDPTEPAPAEPEPTEPAPAEPEPAEPVPAEPEPTEPAPFEPEPPEPAPVEPEPTEPAPVEPEPTEPAPAEPEPTEPAPAEPEPAEPTEPSAPTPASSQDTTPWLIPDQSVGQPAVMPAETQAEDGAIRRPMSEGVKNIVRRARQMTEIQWTPRQNIVGWKGRYVYQAGVTYTGLPYGQPVDTAGYVPWNISLPDFISRVNNYASPMYTSYSNFSGQRAPYYSVDCSGFVSWALDLPGRTTTYYIENYCIRISSTSYANIQVGDILNNPTSHVVLVTDVTYDESGAISSIEISQSTPSPSYYGCCRSTRFSGESGLATFRNSYLNGGYAICRSKTRDNVSYTHECVVPLQEDICPLCSSGTFLRRGVDVSQWQTTIDWQTAAPYLEFAIIRLGFGLNLDSQYQNNVRGCRNNGIPYGLYLYGKATTVDGAKQEAQFVLANLGGYAPDLPIFYDVEELNGNLALPNDELLAVVTAFCSTIEAAGHKAGVYCSTYFWDSKLPDPAYNQWCRWVAHAASVMTCQNGGNLWQCTDNAYIPGIPTNVDLDYWFGPVGNTDHRYRSVSTEPTCTEPGGVGFACVACGAAVCKPISATGHRFANGVCTVCGVEEIDESAQFTDVHADDWYAEAVEFVVERGLFSGVSETSFAPNVSMNRAMMVTVLWRLAGCTQTELEELFTDVDAGSYYAEPVTWAAHLGIVNGTSLTTFSPNRSITREQAATFLYRYAGQLGLDRSARADLDGYPDAGSVGEFAEKAMSWAVAEGLITGSNTVDGLLLLPKGEATRAQIAMILMRFVQYLENDARPLTVGVRPERDPAEAEELSARSDFYRRLIAWVEDDPEAREEIPDAPELEDGPASGFVSR